MYGTNEMYPKAATIGQKVTNLSLKLFRTIATTKCWYSCSPARGSTQRSRVGRVGTSLFAVIIRLAIQSCIHYCALCAATGACVVNTRDKRKTFRFSSSQNNNLPVYLAFYLCSFRLGSLLCNGLCCPLDCCSVRVNGRGSIRS